MKATSILHKALTMNARPKHHLELALRNLKAGEKRLVPMLEEEDQEGEEDEEEKPSGTVWPSIISLLYTWYIKSDMTCIILLIDLQQRLQWAHYIVG